jgi:carbamoyl-phosphate synthase large subunit
MVNRKLCQFLRGENILKDKVNILFTSSGRRVSLIKKFKETFSLEKMKGNIITADLKWNVPTAYISDKHYVVPKVTQKNYLQELLYICIEEDIDLIIPLIDTELPLLAENRHVFAEKDVKLLVSGMELNRIARNKKDTNKFFISHNIKTPRVYSNEELNSDDYQFP